MKKVQIASVLALIGMTFGLYASESKPHIISQPSHSFTHSLKDRVLETIDHADEIPGLKGEEFKALKTKISETWTHLIQDGVLEVDGTDKDMRPIFVSLQGVVEQTLSELQEKGQIDSFRGIIHTPMPATPLCSTGEISKGLVDSSIENDPYRRFTVQERTVTIRRLLQHGGIVYAVYPNGGFEKRSEVQQKVYKQELVNYPNRLLDQPLACASIPGELIGATYFIEQDGQTYVFAIQMTQANDPRDSHYGLWCGPLQNPAIKKRVDVVLNFIGQHRENFAIKVLGTSS